MLSVLEKGIVQIALVVKDLEKTVNNYYELFGIGPWTFYLYEKPFVKEMTRNGVEADYSMRVALSNIGNVRIELIEQKSGDTVYQDFIEKHGYGVHHLGVLADDIDYSIEKCNQAGIKMTMDGKGFGVDGDGHYAYLDTESLLGTTIELIQRPARRKKCEKIFPSEIEDKLSEDKGDKHGV